jgi:hypothetical protein
VTVHGWCGSLVAGGLRESISWHWDHFSPRAESILIAL